MKDRLDYARRSLEKSPVAFLAAAFNTVVKPAESQLTSASVELSRDNSAVIVYPGLNKLPLAAGARAILVEFGNLVATKWSDLDKSRWGFKLVLPVPGQLDAVAARVMGAVNYEETVKSFSSPTDRLVALHVVNALIANKVPEAECHNLDVCKWGPTEDFCTRRVYYSLIPLVGAYCAREASDNFGVMFAGLAMGLELATHSAVSAELKGLVTALSQAGR